MTEEEEEEERARRARRRRQAAIQFLRFIVAHLIAEQQQQQLEEFFKMKQVIRETIDQDIRQWAFESVATSPGQSHVTPAIVQSHVTPAIVQSHITPAKAALDAELQRTFAEFLAAVKPAERRAINADLCAQRAKRVGLVDTPETRTQARRLFGF